MFHVDAPGWAAELNPIFATPPYRELYGRVQAAYHRAPCYPPQPKLLAALELTDLPDVKLVVLGQDPYHTPRRANGLAFAVNADQPVPPSLQNIFKELQDDLGVTVTDRTLISWAKQGVLLLNTSLSVQQGAPGSHLELGWDLVVDAILELVLAKEEPVAFLLMGKKAQERLSTFWVPPEHLLVRTAHPSPYSAAKFFGSKPFSQINRFLGDRAIDWAKEGSEYSLLVHQPNVEYFDGFPITSG